MLIGIEGAFEPEQDMGSDRKVQYIDRAVRKPLHRTKLDFREAHLSETELPRITVVGSLVNRGNGTALSGDCPGIFERRGKDSNLRGLTPHPPARPPPKTTKTFGDGPHLRLVLAPLHPLALILPFRPLLACWRRSSSPC